MLIRVKKLEPPPIKEPPGRWLALVTRVLQRTKAVSIQTKLFRILSSSKFFGQVAIQFTCVICLQIFQQNTNNEEK
jgi:hypothetical protein